MQLSAVRQVKVVKTTTCLMLQIHARASFKGYLYCILSPVVYSHPHFKVSIETNDDDDDTKKLNNFIFWYFLKFLKISVQF